MVLEYQSGEYEAGATFAKQLLELTHVNAEQPTPGFGLTAAALSLVAEITASTKYLEIAQKIAETIISSPLATPTVVLNARVSLALLASQKSDRSIAREQYAAIEPLRSQQCIRISASLAHAVIDRVLGRLAHTIGDTDQAKTHFEDATAFCHTAGYRPELAWTCYDYADMLLTGAHGRGPLHSAKASALLEESLSISTDLGMRPLMERVSQRLERVHILPETSSAYPDGLSRREVEVLRLIAGGTWPTSTKRSAPPTVPKPPGMPCERQCWRWTKTEPPIYKP